MLAANAVIMVRYPERQIAKSASNERVFLFLFLFFFVEGFPTRYTTPEICEITHFPIKDNVKLTLSDTFCIAGITRSRIQSSASGHLDLHRQSAEALFFSAAADCRKLFYNRTQNDKHIRGIML